MTAPIDDFRGEYKWLSNFWREPFRHCEKIWPSSEHAFQAMKTLDPEMQEEIRTAVSPREAKRLGSPRNTRLVLRPGWDAVRIDVMRHILRAKFRSARLAKMLLDTGDAELVEGNTWKDDFWGVYNGKGENWLGRLLMEIREEIRDVSNN